MNHKEMNHTSVGAEAVCGENIRKASVSARCIDHEKAFNSVERMVIATLRWLGMSEAEVSIMDATYV